MAFLFYKVLPYFYEDFVRFLTKRLIYLNPSLMKRFSIVLLFLPLHLVAQDTYERDYKRAVSLYKSGDYAMALNGLIPLCSAKYRHGLVPFAQYYYALAAQKTNRLAESRQTLALLKERFPDWPKMDEVRYLEGDLAFQEKQFGQALDVLQDITDAKIKKDAESLKKYYIASVNDLNYLKTLNRQFPTDKVVGLALIDLIQKTSNDKTDLALSDQLTNRFGAAVPVKTSSTKAQNVPNFQKGYYNVSVMLPFRLKEFSTSQRARNNQFAYDMYEGMKWAKAKLQQEGILVNLFGYDVGPQAAEMNDLMGNSTVQQSDLLIGPVYNESAKMAADFAENNQIFFVHPTSLSTDILANHPRTFLFQPSFERQAEQALNFMRSLPKITNRKVAIYYSNTRKDSVLAANYRTKALAANYLVIDFRKTREKLDSTAAIADWNRPGHVVIFGNSESDGTKVMTMMTKRRVVAPILASSSAFNLNNASASALSKEIYLLDTDFIDTSKPQVREFQAQYMAKRNTIPSVFTMQGYDMLLFFGRMLHKFQSQLRVGLDTRTYEEDYLLSSFNYQKSNDNQTVPIWKVTDMRIERVNE